MRKFSIIGLAVLTLFLIAIVPAESASYEETVAKWTSYKDVENWMKKNFSYDANKVASGIPQSPEVTFERRSGICFDGAFFIKAALDRINPAYNAKLVFIKNKTGPINHWVTAFTSEGKLFVMDYMLGKKLQAWEGLHGPYNSLKGYEKFLSSTPTQDFVMEFVRYRWNKRGFMKPESRSED
jgi:hypothetical protein